MMVFNNEITVRRNETFTIDKIVQNRDGSPYLISSELQNPYFLITITNSLYDQADRYILNIWLPIDESFPRFELTVPFNLADIKTIDGQTNYPNGFEDLDGLPGGYVNGVLVEFEKDDVLFYTEDVEGNRIYKYYDDGWKDYECRIIYKFMQAITKDWVEGTYSYNIDLVSGPINDEAQFISDRPLKGVEELIPILGATKLTVLSDLKGGIEWK